ncbi:MAG: sugar ABC transporter ATP-binding protein [Vicinamibacteria bacterium]
MRGITRRFPGVVALQDVSLALGRGEVLALTGENGAGKSTLIKILGGALAPDAGEVLLDGRPARFASVRDARRAGIALIHQELMLAPNLDVAGNIFLGGEARPLGLVSPLRRGTLYARAEALLKRVGLQQPPDTPVSRLTVGEMQMVEIAKALGHAARIVIMDEPTSSLTAGEAERLFTIVRQLRADGIGVVYISHRMDEVMDLADRVTVLRDGRNAGELTRATATRDRVIELMVGRDLSTGYFPERPAPGPVEPLLEVRDLLVPGAPAPVSFTAGRGEIVGFAGLVGSGRTELMQAVFGVTPALAGRMTLGGGAYAPRSPADAIARGVYLAPEDRKRHGLVLPMTIAQNVSLPALAPRPRLSLLDRAAERRTADAEVARFRVKTPSIHRPVVNLSGGNQQKVVLGKWLALSPRVLIVDEPTRGIDVGAKAEIYRHLAGLAAEGLAILMVSSEMEEVLGLSDRVVVMRERRIAGVLDRSGLSAARVGRLMTGVAEEVAS